MQWIFLSIMRSVCGNSLNPTKNTSFLYLIWLYEVHLVFSMAIFEQYCHNLLFIVHKYSFEKWLEFVRFCLLIFGPLNNSTDISCDTQTSWFFVVPAVFKWYTKLYQNLTRFIYYHIENLQSFTYWFSSYSIFSIFYFFIKSIDLNNL